MFRFSLGISLQLVSLASVVGAPIDSPALSGAWQTLAAATPRSVDRFVTVDAGRIAVAAEGLEARAAEYLMSAQRALNQASGAQPPPPRFGARRRSPRTPPTSPRRARNTISVTPTLEPLLLAKKRVDALFEELLALRGSFVGVSPVEAQRTALKSYLRTLSTLTDLSGQLRYLQFDAIGSAASAAAENPGERERLVALLTQYRSTIGASVMVDLLFDPEGDPRDVAALRASDALKSRVLTLIAAARQNDLLPDLADFLLDEPATPALVIQGAETVRTLGLPQVPRPGQDPTLPPIAISAAELQERLNKLDVSKLDASLRARRVELLTWLDQRLKEGITDHHYTLGQGDFAPGDWLLMRNPSPYNLFTDLSPGLFTHVGVVAGETAGDGITRIVLVDLPERGSRMPATTVDTFVKRTRHYVVLRHEDREVARKMGEAATTMIGNETQFDLNFRTRRVMDMAGKALQGEKIHTYCAGLLLLCALQSGNQREDFFPIAEFPASGNTQANLKTFGMSIGEDFISPTGALFSSKFKIVAQREPMYDPRRAVEEAIFNHFAEQMITANIRPTADAFQSLRLKVAEASKTNPLLAQALASAADISTEMDLVAAAKAAAVVETLDEVATSNSAEFLAAQQALRAGGAEQMTAAGLKPDEIARLQKLRQRHADLYQRWTARRVTPRAMRIELLNYYIAQGRKQLDARFFSR